MTTTHTDFEVCLVSSGVHYIQINTGHNMRLLWSLLPIGHLSETWLNQSRVFSQVRVTTLVGKRLPSVRAICPDLVKCDLYGLLVLNLVFQYFTIRHTHTSYTYTRTVSHLHDTYPMGILVVKDWNPQTGKTDIYAKPRSHSPRTNSRTNFGHLSRDVDEVPELYTFGKTLSFRLWDSHHPEVKWSF